MTVYICTDTHTGNFCIVWDFCSVNDVFVSVFNRYCDRVCWVKFSISGIFYKFVFVDNRIYVFYGKYTFCKSTCFVKYDSIKFSKLFDEVTALNKNTVLWRTTDTGKETKRNWYNQCTRARNHKEHKSAIYPSSEISEKQGRNEHNY